VCQRIIQKLIQVHRRLPEKLRELLSLQDLLLALSIKLQAHFSEPILSVPIVAFATP
jgi:hypothetical protein